MSRKTKLKIGEFSKMMQVTVKTLRHYEQKGLLVPDVIKIREFDVRKPQKKLLE
jgi:DNA-binding transcriptional MerR regulator